MTTTENAIPESQIRLPKNAYTLRCIKCEKATSKAGNKMFNQEFEIINSTPITQDGEVCQLDGVKIFTNASQSDKSLAFFNAQRDALGLQKVRNNEEMQAASPEPYLGQVGAAVCVSEITEDKNDVTGEPIINPNTGKPVISYQKKIVKWLPRN